MILYSDCQPGKGFDIFKAINDGIRIEYTIENYVRHSLFWKMLSEALSAGHDKGHIVDVPENNTTAYVKGNGFLSLRANGAVFPTRSTTHYPDKDTICLSIEVVWASVYNEYGYSETHYIEVPVEVLACKSKQKINGWIKVQRKYIQEKRDEEAKKRADELLEERPEIIKHLKKKLAKID